MAMRRSDDHHNATNIAFHIGFTKAGSTFLQHFFDEHPSVYSFKRGPACKNLLAIDSLAYSDETASQYFGPFLKEAQEREQIPLLSHERLSGSPHSGHYDAEAVCQRIHRLFPDARIIIVLREQYDLIAAIYKRYVQIGGTRKLDDYVDYRWDSRVPRFSWDAYAFHRLIKLYVERFGHNNVLVLLFEQLRASPQDFLMSVEKFLGVDHLRGATLEILNPSMPERGVEMRRIANMFAGDPTTGRLSFREPVPLLSWVPDWAAEKIAHALAERRRQASEYRNKMSVHLRDKYGGRYSNSNRHTAQILSEDLSRFGYEV
jgi:hypothetical protein